MLMRKILCTLICAASLVSAPVMAQSLSPSAHVAGISKVKRVGGSASEESKLRGGGVFVALLAAVAVIGGIIIVAGNNKNSPTSP